MTDKTWSEDIPLDTSWYGYPDGLVLDGRTFLISYCQSGRAPSRVYMVWFRLNDLRTGIELLPVGA